MDRLYKKFKFWDKENKEMISWEEAKEFSISDIPLRNFFEMEQYIPHNLNLTASKGGFQDHLIDKYNLKYCEVFSDKEKVIKRGMPIDTDDYWAIFGNKNFALLDNHKFNRKEQEKIKKILKSNKNENI